jgi:hypothetical protein
MAQRLRRAAISASASASAASVWSQRSGMNNRQSSGSRARVGDRVHADRDLAVGHLSRRPGVLPGHTRRGVPVLEVPGVIQHPRLRRHHLQRPGRQPPPHRHVIPGRGGDELLQPLMIDTQALGHRLHRLTPPVHHQTPQIQPTVQALLTPGERREDLTREVLKTATNRGQLSRSHIMIISQMITT